MDSWQCKTCGYIYYPAFWGKDKINEKDTNSEIFPKDWVCPNCNTEKDNFKKLKGDNEYKNV